MAPENVQCPEWMTGCEGSSMCTAGSPDRHQKLTPWKQLLSRDTIDRRFGFGWLSRKKNSEDLIISDK